MDIFVAHKEQYNQLTADFPTGTILKGCEYLKIYTYRDIYRSIGELIKCKNHYNNDDKSKLCSLISYRLFVGTNLSKVIFSIK